MNIGKKLRKLGIRMWIDGDEPAKPLEPPKPTEAMSPTPTLNPVSRQLQPPSAELKRSPSCPPATFGHEPAKQRLGPVRVVVAGRGRGGQPVLREILMEDGRQVGPAIAERPAGWWK